MRYLIIGLEFNISLNYIIKSLISKYQLKENIFDKKDFIKNTDYSYIYTNEIVIDKLLSIHINFKPFYRDEIEQILYLDIKDEYFDYIKIIKTNTIKILDNYIKQSITYILPDRYKNLVEIINQKYKRTKNIFVIDFNYYKYITDSKYIDSDIINNIYNIINKFDVIIDIRQQYNIFDIKNPINYKYVLCLCFEHEYINIVDVINYLQDLIKESKYKINTKDILQQPDKNCYLILNEELINIILNTNKYSLEYYINNNIQENYEFRYKDIKNSILDKLLIKINENYVNKINIINSCSSDIVQQIKRQPSYILPQCIEYDEIFNDLQSDSKKYETKYVISLNESIDNIKDIIVFFDYI